MFTFLVAQKKQPQRGDWYSEKQSIMEDLEITISDDEIKRTPARVFKKTLKIRAARAGLIYLKELQKKGTKGSLIIYDSLEVQDDLNPSTNMKIEDQRYLFSLRSEMNILHTNFSRNKKKQPKFCGKECYIKLNNEHIVFLLNTKQK